MKQAAFFVGIAAVIIYFVGYLQKKRKAIILFNVTSRALYILQYILLFAFEGAALDIAGIIASILAGKKDKPFIRRRLKLFVALSALLVIAPIFFTYKNIFSIFPVIGVLLHTGAFWLDDEKAIRRVSFLGSPFWLIYNFVCGAYGSCLGDILSMVSLGISMYRFDCSDKAKRFIPGIVLSACGGLVAAYTIVLLFYSNLTLGTFITAFIGIFLILCGVFFEKIKKFCSKKVGKIVLAFFVCIIAAQAGFAGFLAVFGRGDNVTLEEDAVIVLGAGLRGDKVSEPLRLRLEKAAEYHRENPDAFIVVSGGMGHGESVTEAYAMEQYLILHGVDPKVILKEEKATSTAENMEFSKKILDEKTGKNCSVAVITNDFHIYRGVYYAEKAGFDDVTHLHASLKWYNIIPCYLREIPAVMKMWVMD